MIIDLHIHSNISDGVLSPKEVIDEADKNGVSLISITDHDTIDSYTPELFSYAKSKKIKIIPGVEISSKNEKAGIHVLGYNFDLENKEFRETLFKIRNSRHEYLHNVSKKLSKLGYLVNVEKLDKIDSVTKAHIALDIVENEKNRELDLKKREEAKLMKEKLEKITLNFRVKSSKDSRMFGSISTKQIKEELQKQGFNIDKKQIESKTINSLGMHIVTITLYKDIVCNLKVHTESV